jgi:SAM-dependent methyltransferase
MTKVARNILTGELVVKGFVKRLLGMRTEAASEFRNPDYQRYIQRRLEHLASLNLPISRSTVLEVGAGIGELTSFFLDRECKVVATDARVDSLTSLKAKLPELDARVLDLENPGTTLGDDEIFDLVFCYGVLYHLSRPAEAIRYMASHTGKMMILETRVSPGSGEFFHPYPENRDQPSQALSGQGCRPTRDWIFNRLRDNFAFVYMPITQPHRPNFITDWSRKYDDDAVLNAIFIGAHCELTHPALVNYIPIKQTRDLTG